MNSPLSSGRSGYVLGTALHTLNSEKKNTILLWQLLHGFLVVQAKYFIFLALHLILPLGKQRPLIKWKPNIHTISHESHFPNHETQETLPWEHPLLPEVRPGDWWLPGPQPYSIWLSSKQLTSGKSVCCMFFMDQEIKPVEGCLPTAAQPPRVLHF